MPKILLPFERVSVQKRFLKESRTKQSHKMECDINTIMRQFYKTGLVKHVNRYQGDYSDMPEVEDFQEALAIQQQAEEAFDSLPSKLRSRFHNEPAEFLAFVYDPANKEELVRMGLCKPPSIEADNAPKPVVVVPPTPAKPA